MEYKFTVTPQMECALNGGHAPVLDLSTMTAKCRKCGAPLRVTVMMGGGGQSLLEMEHKAQAETAALMKRLKGRGDEAMQGL